MPDVQHLVVPVAEGGELIFAHARGDSVWVWMRALTRRVDEHPRRPTPLYGGSLTDKAPLHDFLADYLDQEQQHHSGVPVVPGRVHHVPPLIRRTDLASPTSNRFFAVRDLSPLHTSVPWTGAAPELLFSAARKPSPPVPDGPKQRSIGYFATGLPELPPGAAPDPLSEQMPVAAIQRDMVELTVGFLEWRHGVNPRWRQGESVSWRHRARPAT
ncbi:hypothetical protein ACIP9H_34050 [Streptomyces sp. NPDC088732]|uniref:hypothetical protein n=1 Tax=Streptomyces sp. NPDC088732 TaxID=3365879 RepID=UPI003823AE74